MNQDVTTESGLLVPASAITKTARTLHSDTFKRLTRFLKTMSAEHLTTFLVCDFCKQPISFELHDRIDAVDLAGKSAGGGRVIFVCQCSNRAVR